MTEVYKNNERFCLIVISHSSNRKEYPSLACANPCLLPLANMLEKSVSVRVRRGSPWSQESRVLAAPSERLILPLSSRLLFFCRNPTCPQQKSCLRGSHLRSFLTLISVFHEVLHLSFWAERRIVGGPWGGGGRALGHQRQNSATYVVRAHLKRNERIFKTLQKRTFRAS